MKDASLRIAQLKDNLSATLRSVQRGRRVVVLDRDRPIALIVPYVEDDDDDAPYQSTPPKRPFSSIRNKRYPPTRKRIDPVATLMIERGDR